MAILPLERTEKRDSFIFCVIIRFILFLPVSTIALQFLCEPPPHEMTMIILMSFCKKTDLHEYEFSFVRHIYVACD